MALTRVTSGGIAEGVQIKFDSSNTPTTPAIAFEGDENTGIFQSDDDELSIATAGQVRVTFKADGSIETGNGTILGGTNPDFENAQNITLYVNQSDKNATDKETNDGGNLNKPFKTIERALLEAAKRSYKADPTPIAVTAIEVGKTYRITTVGTTNFEDIGASSNTVGVSFLATAAGTGTGTVTLSNDKFESFTIMVLPGQYEIDNRPGLDRTDNPLTQNVIETVGGSAVQGNLETGSSWRFNPRNGGIIVPRGTSIVGYDLRKTVIRPKYVPAPFSIEGSIEADSYSLLQIAYDGANMIEKNRGYIVDQARLAIAGSAGWADLDNDEQRNLCIRDIGYFVDAIIRDLREGGNENTFVNAEAYIDGNGYRREFLNLNDTDVTNEVAATRLAFSTAVNVMRDIVKSYTDTTSYHTEITSGKLIDRTTFSGSGDGYGNPNDSSNTTGQGDCTNVVNTVAILGAIADGILSNPSNYTTQSVTYTAIGPNAGSITIPLRKTQGVYNQTSIFKVTGGCYFWQMTFKDAVGTPYNSVTFDANGIPTFTQAANPNYSHHRVVSFTYADQRNTDGELEQYYKKIDAWQGRTIDVSDVRTEEFQIVGDRSKNYTIDTVNSCSPYIFNCSLRSVFGLCGMHTDGNKVAENSFKSMVVAQFTGISLQKDRSVFISPSDLEGDTNVGSSPTTAYNDDDPNTPQPPVFADPDAQYKHDCRHFHIKASNGGFIQVVSVFAVGYADQFLAVSGGDMSITNSNSNFGQISLRAKGSQFKSFAPSSQGRITALIPPRGISSSVSDVTFYNIAATNTWSFIGAVGEELTDELKSKRDGYLSSGGFRLYLETGATTEADIPELVVDSVDQNGNTVTKRFLSYGTSGQYALFRDFYEKDGVTPDANRIINLPLESTGGDSDRLFSIKCVTTIDSVDNPQKDGSPTTSNLERIGYFWDPFEKCVYVKLDHTHTPTDTFIEDFIFDSNEEKSFEFVSAIDPNTGITTTELQQVTKELLKYKTGFPSSLIVKKFADTRTSSPGDLLWKIEYTIPKYLGNNINPKPPEKRFIIKGTRSGNGEKGVPYTDYRFMVWDVEEVQSWEYNERDGIYYLTVIRADVNEFVDERNGSGNNVVSTIRRRPLGISAGEYFACSTIEQVNLNDKETRLIGNVNYLYPSVNEEGPTYDIKKIWNPPQSDSRVLVEGIDAGSRIKDIVVPNYKRFKLVGNVADTTAPFKDIPSLQSMTAEAAHRLVQSLDLRYVLSTGFASTDRVFVAPVTSWDSRVSDGDEHTTSSNNLYSTQRRFGQALDDSPSGIVETKSETITLYNTYGVNKEAFERRILVCSLSAEGVNSSTRAITAATLNKNSSTNADGLKFAPKLNLYRPSILRASSHTWEYIGLGSGNYSTGFPNLQTRVLKIYEQFIAQGYENAGGFIASSGTNSAGDFYIGNQVIQAGGTSTVTLNVPKLRKSSESNYLDIENIENRISNAVINVTASASRSASAQSALKDLANFFNIAKLTVSDKANINNLIIGERLFIDRAEINNAAFFPEGNTSAYGFVKGAKPEKTGFISTDTNDKLYVSPKYLDAWRVKRQLISAQAVTLDNNRVYIQPYLQSALTGFTSAVSGTTRYTSYQGLTFTDTTVNGVTVSGSDPINLVLAETAGIASFGKIDVQFNLTGIAIQDYYIDGNSEKQYLNTFVTIPLSYESVDYTTNTVTLSRNQNGLGIVDYLKSYLGNGTHKHIVRNFPPITADGAFGINATEDDVKYLKSRLETSFDTSSHTAIDRDNTAEYQTIYVTMGSQAEYDSWPDRGCISLREYPKGSSIYRIATFKYYKSAYYGGAGDVNGDHPNTGAFVLFENYAAGTSENGASYNYDSTYDNGYPGITSANVFFTGCDTLAFDSDRWASESPFIPPLDPTKGVVEEVNIEDAILYRVPEKKLPLAIDLDEDYFDQRLPNPYSSKALGVNIQERSEVKRFSPLFSFSQCRQWAENSGFNSDDELELLMKPGYYKLDGTSFPCSIKINGSGVSNSSVFAGKERTRVSAGRMGGYLEDTVKRGDSVYLYRTMSFTPQYGVGNDAIYTSVSGGLSANGSVSLNNVHIIGINESITKNEIPDSIFSEDKKLQNARRLVRNAYFTKSAIRKDTNTATHDGIAGVALGNTKATSNVEGGIDLLVSAKGDSGNAPNTGNTQSVAHPVVNSGDIIESDISSSNYLELKEATIDNCRYYSISIDATDFAGSTAEKLKYDRMRKYIVPGTTMYWLTNATDTVVQDVDDQTTANITASTKVISVRKHKPSTSLDFDSNSEERIEVLVSVYQTDSAQTNGNSSSYTNPVEDLDPGAWAGSVRKVVFLNEDGAEYTTLVYNWALEERRSYLPKGTMHEGGYQGPILKKTTANAINNQANITVDNINDVSIGDRVAWLDVDGVDQLSGFRVSNIVGNVLTLTDNIPTGVTVPSGSILSFTKFNAFGDEIEKYDIPEIYGILTGLEGSNILLVVDRNPNVIYDKSIVAYPFASGSFTNSPTQLMQLKTNHDFINNAATERGSIEDNMLAFNKRTASTQRILGVPNNRYIYLDISPTDFAGASGITSGSGDADPENASVVNYIENAGIHKDILLSFASYTQQSIANGGALGKGYTTQSIAINSSDATTINNTIATHFATGGGAGVLENTRNYNNRLRVGVFGGSTGSWRFYAQINTSTGQITAIKTYWGGGNTTPTVLNGTFTFEVTDGIGFILSPTGNTVSTSSSLGRLSSLDFAAVAKANLLTGSKLNEDGSGASDGSPYLESVETDANGDNIILSARGKKIFNSWPRAYRSFRRRFPLAGIPVNGNYQSSLISVDAIPGSDFRLNLTGVTIGAQSPASSRANTFGGGYRGGLIKCRGAQLTLNGTRFRGNLSLDWTGLMTHDDKRSSKQSAFIAGHSIEMFQMEDQNSFSQIGGSRPAYAITTSGDDEEFRQLSEFNPTSNIYLEPGRDPYGTLSDGDARTFPLATKQAIRRFNKSSSAVTPWDGATEIQRGKLLTQVALFERYQTPFAISYNAPNGNPTGTDPQTAYIPINDANAPTANKASGVYLRWNDTNSTINNVYTVSGGENISLPRRTIGFFVANTDAGLDVPANIFFGTNATNIVKTTNIETSYSVVTSQSISADSYDINNSGVIELNNSGGKYKFITVTGDRANAFSSLSASNGTNINFNTDYLNAKRYNYVSTVTSRYAKTTQNRTAKLILTETSETTNYSEPANYSIANEDATFSVGANYTTSTELFLVNISKETATPGVFDGVTSGKVVITTDSNSRLTSMYILDPGTGHQTGDQMKLRTSESGSNISDFELTVRSNYSDEDFSIFAPGEYKVMLPTNCFILNAIESGSSAKNLKQQINAAKSIFKPGSYILHNGLYYKIATSDATNNKSYIGVYRYVNSQNITDIRADIIVELEDPDQNPTYNQNTRFDLFDYDNILDYWPTSGRLVIGKRETCDFTKGGLSTDPKGYEIRLTRSMTKYWPHYIRDWEGLDPNNSTDDAVAAESIIPTELRLSDPVDVTCYGLKRFSSTGADNISEVTTTDYTTPTGIVTDKTATICVTSNDTTADFEKLSIGQTVTIPYRNISSGTTAANTSNWNSFKITVGDKQGSIGTNSSSNREGDRYITGTFRTDQDTISVDDKQTFNLHGLNTNDTSIYEFLNPLTSVQFVPSRTSISQFNQRGFRQRPSYLSARTGDSLSTSIVSDTLGTGLASNVEGALHFTVAANYARTMQRISTFGEWSCTFRQVDTTNDQFEVIMDVTSVADGALYKGQRIFLKSGNSTNSNPVINTIGGSAGAWTNVNETSGGSYDSADLVGYVVGMRGDYISTTFGENGTEYIYEDGEELTGVGGVGTYRVLLTSPYTNANQTTSNITFSNGISSSIDILGERGSTDYFVAGSYQDMWWDEPGVGVYRYIHKRVVLQDDTNVIYFRYSNSSGTGLRATDDSTYDGGTSLPSNSYVLFYYQGFYDNTIKLKLDKPLSTDIAEGTVLTLAPTPNRTNKDSDYNFLFKSRILDLQKESGRIKVYLADPLPKSNWQAGVYGSEQTVQSNTTDTPVKTYGLMYINDGGWTYPKTGGSSFRANNIYLGTNTAGTLTDKIYIPNRSGRIKAGDQLSYTWEDTLRIQSDLGINGTASGSGTTDEVIQLYVANTDTKQATLTGTDASKAICVLRPGYVLFTAAGVEIGTIASISGTTITLTENAKVTIGTNETSGADFKYTTTGKAITYNATIQVVGPVDSNGYSQCTVTESQNHILHNGIIQNLRDLFATIDEVYVSHREGNFISDGPIVKTFIYSDTGVKLSFGEYRVWYENYSNYIRPIDTTRQAMSGRQGWVGNFGLSTSGSRTLGISLNGASSLQRGRQYNSGMWLTAVPVHAWWESTGYSRYMLQCDTNTSIESNYISKVTPIAYDGSGNFRLNVLNHTKLTTGSVYAAANTGETNSIGAGTFDTQHYKLLSTNTKLKYSLQNGTVSSTGTVTGGDKSRLSEQFVIDRVVTYKPTHLNTRSIGSSTSITFSDRLTGTVSSVANAKRITPGDVLYSAATPSKTTFIGIVKSVDYTTAVVTLEQKSSNSGLTDAGGTISNCSIITPRGFISTQSDSGAFASQQLVFSGDADSSGVTLQNAGANDTSPNVIGDGEPGYNKYNIRFNIDRRVYNQTTLINTYGNLKSVNSFDVADRVIDVRFGDLATYSSPMLNIEVTRFNPKTHVESSISVVGENLHI